MKFDLASDLHLDIGGVDELMKSWVVSAPVLVLAGDIVEVTLLKKHKNRHQKSIREFFTFISANYVQVFWVFGNHEHYAGNMVYDHSNANSVLNSLGIYNITILNDNITEYDDTLIYGSTLWTSMRDRNIFAMSACGTMMNDYRMIKINDVPISPEHTIWLHEKSIQSLNKFISISTDKKKLVITHHAPCFLSISDDHRLNSMVDAYYTELSGIISYSDISTWVHGHTHLEVMYNINQCRVYSKPRGYYGYDQNAMNFSPMMIDA